MYPLVGSGMVLSWPCRRSFSDYFIKTHCFYFRCRCSGADLQEMRSLAPPQPQAKYPSRRPSMAEPTITSSIGAAAINSGFMCQLTSRR